MLIFSGYSKPYCYGRFISLIAMVIGGSKSTLVATVLFVCLFFSYKLLFKELPLVWVIFISLFFIFVAAGGAIVHELGRRTIEVYKGNERINISSRCTDALEDFFGLQQTAYYSIGWMIYILYCSFKLTYNTFILPDKDDKTLHAIPFLAISAAPEVTARAFSLKTLSDGVRKDIGIALTDIRKIYFYYNVLNGIGLSALIYMLLAVSSIKTTNIQTIVLFFLTTFVFSQLPYTLGQAKLQSTLLAAKEGVERKDMQEQLDKYLPLFPKFPLIVSLSSGFAGAVLFQLTQEAFKTLAK